MHNKKDERLEIRISGEDYLFLQVQAAKANMTVSAYCRMWIDKSILPLKDKMRNKEITLDDCRQFIEDKKEFKKMFKGK